MKRELPTFACGRKWRARSPRPPKTERLVRETPSGCGGMEEDAMNRKWFQVMTWLMWLALPLTALRYWQVWGGLCAHMAAHFYGFGPAHGGMPRQVSLGFAPGISP